MEIYKVISDYPDYEVSNFGSVRNKKTSRILRPGKFSNGYLGVGLCKDRKHKTFSVHRLVANAFIPNPENKRTVNHINGNKTDNRVENLEWATDSENQKHAYKTGLKVCSDKVGSPKQKVRCIETDQEFESQCDAARCFGCAQNQIRQSIHKGHRVLKQFHFELA